MSEPLHTVYLLGLPVQVHARVGEHMNALQRELELIRRREREYDSVPHRLQALFDQLSTEFGGVGEQPIEEVDAAAERGDETVDLVYRVPAAAVSGAERLGAMLDEVDEYCRAREYLLTLVTPDEGLEYRRWFLGEFVRQIGGDAPTPWADRERVLPSPTVRPTTPAFPVPSAATIHLPEPWTITSTGQSTEIVVVGSLDLQSAPALREALLASVLAGSTIVLDLRQCSFIDSIGLSVILAGLNRANQESATVRFRLSATVERVLRISGVLPLVSVEVST